MIHTLLIYWGLEMFLLDLYLEEKSLSIICCMLLKFIRIWFMVIFFNKAHFKPIIKFNQYACDEMFKLDI